MKQENVQSEGYFLYTRAIINKDVKSMIAAERRQRVLQYVQEHGSAEVPELSEKFGVCIATIRRDLNYLAKEGLIVRSHGGAVSNHLGTSFEPVYDAKKKAHQEEKVRIGEAAFKLINEHETVILDSGSTTFHIAKHLAKLAGVTVVTTDLFIAMELASHPHTKVILAGGAVRNQIFSTEGFYCEEVLRSLNADKVFLAADAIHLERGILNANPSEVPVKKLMIQNCKDVILVADHSKFHKLALSKVADLDVISTIVTDKNLDRATLEALNEKGIRVLAV